MSSPAITKLADGWQYKWEEEKLTIRATRIRLHSSDGRVTGNLLIKSSLYGDRPIYPSTTFNFSSDRTRASLIKTLKDIDLDTHWKWQEIIFQLCVSVEELAKRGEDVQELWTYENSPPPEWLLEPFIFKGLPTVIFGEKAVCKSTISLLIYAALSLTWHENPLGWKVRPEPGYKVLLCDWEVTADVARYNLKRLQEGMELAHLPLYYRRCRLPLTDDIEQIKGHLDSIKADVIIIDSLGFAAGGDLNNADQALRFTAALSQLNCASLIIAQTSKDRNKKGKASTYGSVFFEYFSRNIWELKKTHEDSEDEFDIALFNTYCNLTRKARPMGYHLSFTDQIIKVQQAEITAPDLVERLGTWSRIYDFLSRNGKAPAKQISEELGVSLDIVSKTLRRYAQKGKVAKLPDGSWGLVADTFFGGVQ